jgi:cytochrome c553
MGAQAKDLSEQDIADLAAYFGSLQPQIHDLSGHQR